MVTPGSISPRHAEAWTAAVRVGGHAAIPVDKVKFIMDPHRREEAAAAVESRGNGL